MRWFCLYCLLHTKNMQRGEMYCHGSSELEHPELAHWEAAKLLTERLMLPPLWQLAITWSSWTAFCDYKGQTLMTVLFLTQWLNYNVCVRSYSWQHQQQGSEFPPCIMRHRVGYFTTLAPVWLLRFTTDTTALHSSNSVNISVQYPALIVWYCTTTY